MRRQPPLLAFEFSVRTFEIAWVEFGFQKLNNGSGP